MKKNLLVNMRKQRISIMRVCDKSESHFFKNYSAFVHYQLPIHKMGIRGSDGVLGNVLWDEQ